MKYALVDSSNIVQNVIVYGAPSNYIAPPLLTIMQINDWVNIGDNINTPEPE